MTQYEFNEKVLNLLEAIARLSGMDDAEYDRIDEQITVMQRNIPGDRYDDGDDE